MTARTILITGAAKRVGAGLAKDLAALVDALGLVDYDLGGFSLGSRTSVRAVIGGLRPKRLVLGGWAEEVEPPKRELPRTAKKARTAKPPEGRAAAE